MFMTTNSKILSGYRWSPISYTINKWACFKSIEERTTELLNDFELGSGSQGQWGNCFKWKIKQQLMLIMMKIWFVGISSNLVSAFVDMPPHNCCSLATILLKARVTAPYFLVHKNFHPKEYAPFQTDLFSTNSLIRYCHIVDIKWTFLLPSLPLLHGYHWENDPRWKYCDIQKRIREGSTHSSSIYKEHWDTHV